MAANDTAFKVMYQRLGGSHDDDIKLVGTECINTLDQLVSLTAEQCKAVVKAICHPGGANDGKDVPGKAEHNLSVCCAICQFW